jgi:hypothetical protein
LIELIRLGVPPGYEFRSWASDTIPEVSPPPESADPAPTNPDDINVPSVIQRKAACALPAKFQDGSPTTSDLDPGEDSAESSADDSAGRSAEGGSWESSESGDVNADTPNLQVDADTGHGTFHTL